MLLEYVDQPASLKSRTIRPKRNHFLFGILNVSAVSCELAGEVLTNRWILVSGNCVPNLPVAINQGLNIEFPTFDDGSEGKDMAAPLCKNLLRETEPWHFSAFGC